eukprot:gb/GECG01002314.1/.p1 GENE.gb/GECG01002314.1/~~gb/GECG01002314.1/.p1  ORF type:complete len:602 (+),score=117.25 gb/GECG01002314.1/:1-1806(+)
MATLTRNIPAPVHSYDVYNDERSTEGQIQRQSSGQQIPPYGQRKGYMPRQAQDFGDGGAFPEIHVAQYPLNMGRPGQKKSQQVVPVHVDSSGNVRHDAIVQQFAKDGKVIHSQYQDLVEKDPNKVIMERPSEEAEKATAERTKQALGKIVESQVATKQPVKLPEQSTERHKQSQYFRYTPDENAPGYNPNASQRVVRMAEAPEDPLEPPRFKHKKVPQSKESSPVPILHSPQRKLTVEDQQKWKIPPCISNWKNSRGYTVPLDKRLAADGRSLQTSTINDKFSTLSEALYVAERKARDEVESRAQIRKRLNQQEKEKKEEELRKVAEQKRRERAGLPQAEGGPSQQYQGEQGENGHYDDEEEGYGREEARGRRRSRSESDEEEGGGQEDEDEKARVEREKIRLERKRERERELRLEQSGVKTKRMRDADRDVSEKIALGMNQGKNLGGNESMFDQRLFNQEQGLTTGFGHEDEYNVYSKPLREDTGRSVYRPNVGDSEAYGNPEEQLEKLKGARTFKPDVDFEGVDRSKKGSRDQPVQFEKSGEKEDVFGLDKFLSETKEGKKSSLDAIGSTGRMHATAGSGSSGTSSGRRNIQFHGASKK